MKPMTLLASMPPPLGSPTPLNTQTTASDSSSACRLTCRGWSLAGVSLRGRGDGFPAFPDIQGHCSLLLSWTQPFSSWPSQIRSRSPSNTLSQGWCSAHAPVSRARPFLFLRRISLLTFVLPDPSMGKGEGRLEEGRGERRGEEHSLSFPSVLLLWAPVGGHGDMPRWAGRWNVGERTSPGLDFFIPCVHLSHLRGLQMEQ